MVELIKDGKKIVTHEVDAKGWLDAGWKPIKEESKEEAKTSTRKK